MFRDGVQEWLDTTKNSIICDWLRHGGRDTFEQAGRRKECAKDKVDFLLVAEAHLMHHLSQAWSIISESCRLGKVDRDFPEHLAAWRTSLQHNIGSVRKAEFKEPRPSCKLHHFEWALKEKGAEPILKLQWQAEVTGDHYNGLSTLDCCAVRVSSGAKVPAPGLSSESGPSLKSDSPSGSSILHTTVIRSTREATSSLQSEQTTLGCGLTAPSKSSIRQRLKRFVKRA